MSGACAEAEAGQQCAQVQVNEYKENENIAYTSLRPIQTTTLGKTAKVYLSPFSLSNSKLGLFKLSESPVEKSSSNAVCKKTSLKKACRTVLTPKMKALSSKAESGLLKLSSEAYPQSTKLEHRSTSDSGPLGADVHSSDEDSAPGLVRPDLYFSSQF